MMESAELSGQHIFVTGGASRTGGAVVSGALAAGAKVSFVDIDLARGVALERELLAAGFDISFTCVDVTNFSDLEKAYQESVRKFGPVSGLVNNANVKANFDAVEMSEAQWERLFAVDLKAIWYTAKLALPDMRKAARGSIVSLGSMHASQTREDYFPYSAAKSALMGMTRNLAIDEGQFNIRANVISAGYSGSVDPVKIANVAVFLLSDGASFVSGSEWPVDGGLSARLTP